MVAIAKSLGYDARVGAMQANCGTPFENGIHDLKVSLAEVRAQQFTASEDSGLVAGIERLAADLAAAIGLATPGAGPNDSWATVDLDVTNDLVVDGRDLQGARARERNQERQPPLGCGRRSVMPMITNATLLARRLGQARCRRETILDRQRCLRDSLPKWARAPPQLIGMSAAKVDEIASDRSEAERQAASDEIGRELDRLDRDIEQVEDQLLMARCSSLAGIQVILDLALTHLRSKTVGHPSDFFYVQGDTRVVAFLDAAAESLRRLPAAEHRLAS
jgi:hypothetical protein